MQAKHATEIDCEDFQKDRKAVTRLSSLSRSLRLISSLVCDPVRAPQASGLRLDESSTGS